MTLPGGRGGGLAVGTLACLRGQKAPVRRFLSDLIDLILRGQVNSGAVFDLEPPPLGEAAEGCKAMDERRATKVLLTF